MGLMGYMYQLEPGPAVLQMTAIDSEFSTIRNLLSIAHPDTTPAYRRPPKKCLLLNFQSEWDTKKLRTEFERLSRNQKWWVRLWVIETLKQLPELEEESILEGFKTDPNESIRERLLKADQFHGNIARPETRSRRNLAKANDLKQMEEMVEEIGTVTIRRRMGTVTNGAKLSESCA